MKKIKLFLLSIISVFMLAIFTGFSTVLAEEKANKVEIKVFAAASLKDVLEEVTANYEKIHGNVKFTFTYGGSGSLQQMIEQGKSADLFISAAEKNFTPLVEKGYINPNQAINFLGNELVLAVPIEKNIVHSFSDLNRNNVEKIAIGNPATVPAGMYAKQVFEGLNLYEVLKPKFVLATDVRHVLSLIETKQVEAGLVYKTDALISPQVKIVDTADPSLHTPIIYPMGVLESAQSPTETTEYYNYLQTIQVKEKFEKYGFSVLNKKQEFKKAS
ncbi:molybdate ABC transporter substrate-binding protein [Bacillus cereus group sp. MYBK108-2]|uniref:molybdate ABC transporter substrate-binding protein n=1 Tax=unclassified Bacillus cereus group TaxID=2750818 RepID=UPI0028920BA6|nr:molybdate ABC transporter substrate-binding protein [Bacillus cereus]MDA2307639.1 molybdate ABC transporter substrate-binding protein [Bacillus cereus]HDX9634228.1 molybdate ABC transporter substrate-binding protein [Bacillus cereus]HEF1897115.1 molybdate ABC transporter substrate-binding protein [Bacillus cereus]